jgi:hypothetical protein
MHSGIAQMTIAIIVLLLCSGYKTSLSGGQAGTDHPVLSEEEMRQWNTYTDNSITFRYPKKITLRKTKGRIVLTHSIKFKHADPCDFAGDKDDLNTLIDFRVSLEIS